MSKYIDWPGTFTNTDRMSRYLDWTERFTNIDRTSMYNDRIWRFTNICKTSGYIDRTGRFTILITLITLFIATPLLLANGEYQQVFSCGHLSKTHHIGIFHPPLVVDDFHLFLLHVSYFSDT